MTFHMPRGAVDPTVLRRDGALVRRGHPRYVLDRRVEPPSVRSAWSSHALSRRRPTRWLCAANGRTHPDEIRRWQLTVADVQAALH
ncbi:hypothetical protein [Frankia sp. Mgl5]|uniref:hypothetical protein n=1 Tax=Frankia sp. Mgl5 TaxID=2933793 RepID=UPI00200CF44E|nr:hypothetical protein [Frankia sp. Mgl5]